MRYQSINWKYVFVFILVIAIVFSGFYTFFPDLLYGIGKIYESAGKQDVAQDYYEKILQIDPMSPMIAFTTHRKFLKVLSSQDFNLMTGLVYISTNGSGMSGSKISKENLEKLNQEYIKAMKSTIDKDLKLKLSLDAALLNWFGGDYQKSLELLKQQSESKDVILLDYQRLFLACMYLLMGQVEEVPSLINEQNIHTYHPSLQQKVLAILDYYYILLGNRDRFQEYTKEDTLNACAPIPSEYKIYANLLDVEETTRDLWRVTEKSKDSVKHQGSIHGRMVIGNKPFPYQKLILKAQDDHTFSSYPWTNDFIGIAITDQEGKFSFENVRKGIYYIAAYVPWPLVKEKNFRINDARFIDLVHHTKQTVNIVFEPKLSIKTVTPSEDHTKFTFTFDKVEGADYYTLAMGEVDTENQGKNVAYTFYSEPFTTNHITIDVNQHRGKKSGGTSWD